MRNSLFFLSLLLLVFRVEAQRVILKDRLTIDKAPLKVFTIGGSLSSGVRDDGLNKEFQSKSFATLFSTHLNSGKVVLPDFEPSETVKVKIDDYGTPIFDIEEKRFLDNPSEIEFSKDVGLLHNFSVPFQKLLNIDMRDRVFVDPHLDKRSFDYLKVLQSHNSMFSNLSYKDIIDLKSKEDFDFFLYELGFDDFLSYLKAGGYRTSVGFMYNMEPGIEQYFLKNLSPAAQGVIINVPDPTQLPFFKILNNSHLESFTSLNDFFIKVFGGTQTLKFGERDLILYDKDLYNSLVGSDSNIGRSYETALADNYVLSSHELSSVQVHVYNKKLSYIAKQNDICIVDLYSLYKKILSGDYTTYDGVKIEPSFPEGNFFSSDGIFPTALGHRVICNEVISAINKHYDLKINYLPTLN